MEWEKLPEATKENIMRALPTKDLSLEVFENAKHKFGDLIHDFQNVEWEKLPEAAKEHIRRNPRMTAVQIALTLVTLCSGLVAGPGLLLSGFGRLGPVAGEVFCSIAFFSILMHVQVLLPRFSSLLSVHLLRFGCCRVLL